MSTVTLCLPPVQQRKQKSYPERFDHLAIKTVSINKWRRTRICPLESSLKMSKFLLLVTVIAIVETVIRHSSMRGASGVLS